MAFLTPSDPRDLEGALAIGTRSCKEIHAESASLLSLSVPEVDEV
jgi:hypothetical protein